MPYPTRQIYINLPVSSPSHSITFYTALGFTQNHAMTDPSGGVTMMALPPLTNGVGAINVMLLSHEKFQGFMPKEREIGDARKSTGVLLCLSCGSKGEVDEWLEKAIKAGGRGEVCPKQEMGEMMYGTSFEDLDGHVWEVVWMDERFAGGEGEGGKECIAR
jgi:uncharacterized protein